MPLFFASNAIYPIAIMPIWLQFVARVNPLSYEVDALRGLMVVGGEHINPIGLDFAVIAVIATILIALAVRLYPRLIQ